MFEKAKPVRDTFTFSLSGMAAINSFAIPPVVADDGINEALDRRLANKSQARDSQLSLVQRLEDALARYFVPGRCEEA